MFIPDITGSFEAVMLPFFVPCPATFGAFKFDISEVGSGSTNGASFKVFELLFLFLFLLANLYEGELLKNVRKWMI